VKDGREGGREGPKNFPKKIMGGPIKIFIEVAKKKLPPSNLPPESEYS